METKEMIWNPKKEKWIMYNPSDLEINPNDLVAALIKWEKQGENPLSKLTKQDFGDIMHNPIYSNTERDRLVEAMDSASIEYDDLAEQVMGEMRPERKERQQQILNTLVN